MVILPFLSLSKTLATPIVGSLNALRFCMHAKQRSWQMLASGAAFLTFFFQQRLSLILTSFQDVGKSLQRVWEREYGEVLPLATNSLYLGALCFGGLEIQCAALAFSVLTEGFLSWKELRKGYALEGLAHMAMGMIRVGQMAPSARAVRDKWKMDQLFSKIAKNFYSMAHELAKPVHKLCINAYESKSSIPSLVFQGVFATICAIGSVASSTFGSLFLYASGKSYLLETVNCDGSSERGDQMRILNCNVGFLPSELAQKLTVGDFSMSSEERAAAIIDYLVREYQTHDLLLLEEVVDFGFVQQLIESLHSSGLPAHIYSRIGDPLYPGIASGLCMVSRTPLENIQVETLPHSNWFFNRSLVVIDDRIAFSHLNASDEEVRREQLSRILSRIQEGYLIGDYNFPGNAPLPGVRRITHIDDDLVAVVGDAPDPGVVVCQDIGLSDHQPLDIRLPQQHDGPDSKL